MLEFNFWKLLRLKRGVCVRNIDNVKDLSVKMNSEISWTLLTTNIYSGKANSVNTFNGLPSPFYFIIIKKKSEELSPA